MAQHLKWLVLCGTVTVRLVYIHPVLHRCDGEGRIIGGLAALPGFGWWPIKAYRPCSALSAAGMDYVR